jgi:hypothetical protein
MAGIGDSTSGSVPSTAPGNGPQDARGKVGKHVTGSGDHPGMGASAGPSDQSPENTHQGLK